MFFSDIRCIVVVVDVLIIIVIIDIIIIIIIIIIIANQKTSVVLALYLLKLPWWSVFCVMMWEYIYIYVCVYRERYLDAIMLIGHC